MPRSSIGEMMGEAISRGVDALSPNEENVEEKDCRANIPMYPTTSTYHNVASLFFTGTMGN